MEEFKAASKSVYQRLNVVIGYPEEIKIRHDISEIFENISKMEQSDNSSVVMISGSFREGFRLRTSDVDTMRWRTDHKVITDLSQINMYSSSQKALILMDSRNTRPGFVLLQLLNKTCRGPNMLSCIYRDNKIYISSSLHREVMVACITENEHQSGPCWSGCYGKTEYDVAFSFQCDTLPKLAYPWIVRSEKRGWPTANVLNGIVSGGCHVVAIGSKQSPSEDIEWRISFSLAEQKLVYSMDHVQFLCYGLLKLFLKEVLHKSIEGKLLCSYHMKTAVFWEIQETFPAQWSSDYILMYFLICFKRIIHWVKTGYCPSLFIPQNNLFLHKVVGRDKETLLNQLIEIYNCGYKCLLLCPSLCAVLADAVMFPRETLSYLKYECFTESRMDIAFFNEINDTLVIPIGDMQRLVLIHHFLTNLSSTENISDNQKCVIRVSIVRYQVNIVFKLFEHKSGNRQNYKMLTVQHNMLTRAVQNGALSDLLYMALFLYVTGRFKKCLKILQEAKFMLSQPFVYYSGKEFNIKSYTYCLKKQSLARKIKSSLAMNIWIMKWFCITDLSLELACLCENDSLAISPFVFASFLSFLCSYHLKDSTGMSAFLFDLQKLIHSDKGKFIMEGTLDISWELLGICQQIFGDYKSAVYSYQQQCLAMLDINNIQKAAIARMKQIKNLIKH